MPSDFYGEFMLNFAGSTDAAFQKAQQLHQAGRLTEAEALYRQVLAVQPQHAETLHSLGMLAGVSGRPDLAAEWIAKAIAANVALLVFPTSQLIPAAILRGVGFEPTTKGL